LGSLEGSSKRLVPAGAFNPGSAVGKIVVPATQSCAHIPFVLKRVLFTDPLISRLMLLLPKETLI
jgi:hypothetical protein